VIACNGSNNNEESVSSNDLNPDALPVMTNRDLPFRYPPALYAQKVQGNVTLRIHIDSAGKVANDSTKVIETSGQSALDSAAVRGSRELSFVPAKRRGTPMAVSILFPVYFRHPEAPPLPGDSAIKKSAATAPTTPTTQ
jgi:TonB family protein